MSSSTNTSATTKTLQTTLDRCAHLIICSSFDVRSTAKANEAGSHFYRSSAQPPALHVDTHSLGSSR